MMGSMIFRALLAALATGWAASTANCTNTEPVLGEVVTCPAVGDELVTVPPGSNNVLAVVVGAGGGAGYSVVAGGTGSTLSAGAGRNITAIVLFPNNTAYLRVTVGRAGSKYYGATLSSGGSGGNASTLSALDDQGNVIAMMIVSGGGGGGGFRRNATATSPFGGDATYFDGARNYPLSQSLGFGTPANSATGKLPVYSTGYSITPNSAGVGGIPAPFLSTPPTSYDSTKISYLFMDGGVPGVNVLQGSPGQNQSDVPFGSIAAGGEPIVNSGSGPGGQQVYCAGGGGHGYGGGASGSVILQWVGCTGGGGGGGGVLVNSSLLPPQFPTGNPLLNAPATGATYGVSGKPGMVSLIFMTPFASVSPTPSVTSTKTASRTASVSSSVSSSPSISRSPSRSSSPSKSISRTATSSASASVSPGNMPDPGNVTASETPSSTASSTASSSATPSSSVTASETASCSHSVSQSPSASETVSGSPSATETLSGSSSATGSFSGTPAASLAAGSTSVSPSATSSASTSASRSHDASSSGSPSRSPSGTASASHSASVSVSATRAASLFATGSVSGSVTSSASGSSSVTSSLSDSSSVTATATRSRSQSPSQSRSGSPTASRSETSSATGTPSETLTSTETGTMTSTASMTVSATATRSVTATQGIVVPAISLSFTLVGGDEDSLRAGTGTLLREAVNNLVGVDGAYSSFTQLVTNYTVTEVDAVYNLANVTANTTRVNASDVLPGSSQVISPNDPDLNAPLRRRRQLQSSQASCSPVVLPTNGTITVPFTTAYMMVQIPPSYFADNGAYTPAQIAALIAQLQAQFYASLANPAVVTTAMASFTEAWSTCTGMPDSTGVIAAIAQPTAVNVPSPTPVPVPTPDNSSIRNGVLIGVITGGLFIMLVVAIAMGCSRRRKIFAPSDAFMFVGEAHECELSQVWDWPIRVPAAGLNGTFPAWTIRACPHITLRYTASVALRSAGFELSEPLLQGASLVFKDRSLAVSVDGDKPLGALGIFADAAVGTEGVVLVASSAAATTGPATCGSAAAPAAAASAGGTSASAV